MRVYGKLEEKLLSHIAHQPNIERGLTWSDIYYSWLQSATGRFISKDHVFERGLDIEELTLTLKCDPEKAWEAAEPYYKAAQLRGHAKAWYRFAMHWGESDHSEFIYAHYLEGAANRGYLPAIKDFFNYYEEFKVKTVTNDAWKRKRKQEKTYFKCCKILANAKNADAVWKLSECYLYGTGVKKDISKAIVVRSEAMELMGLDDEAKKDLLLSQEFHLALSADREPFAKIFFKTVKGLFTGKGTNA